MNDMTTDIQQGIVRHLIKSVVLIVIFGGLIFVSAGDWSWSGGWTYLALVVANFVVASVILIPTQPELLARRSEIGAGTPQWDRYLAPIVGWAPLYIGVISGVAYRFTGGEEGSIVIRVIAGLVVIGSNLLTIWTMVHNPYFEATVRIQSDEGHRVAAGGPYRWVRHPGYLSSLLLSLPAPLIYGTSWGYIGVAILAGAVLSRTLLEDRFLRENLDGYAEYARRTRRRLVPGVW